MAESKLRELSMEFSVDIINLVKFLKSNHESVIANQIGRSGTSIGANITRHSMRKAKRILYPSLKLPSKKQAKRDIGLNLHTERTILTKSNIKFCPINALRSALCLFLLAERRKQILITNNFRIFIWTYDFLSVSWCLPQTERKFLYGIRTQTLLPSKICPRLRTKQLSQRAAEGRF